MYMYMYILYLFVWHTYIYNKVTHYNKLDKRYKVYTIKFTSLSYIVKPSYHLTPWKKIIYNCTDQIKISIDQY